MSALQTITANFAGRTRRVVSNGRDYIVAPLTMIVPGVLRGSKGPLYYPADEVTRNYDAWNGIPIVADHPRINGRYVSARSPEVLEAFQIGHVFSVNAHGKLTAEGWFDVAAIKRIDPRILDKLNSGQPIELSTGLFTDNYPAPPGAVFNGRPYDYVARNFRPDHLAVLVDKVGACSVQDGCGVLVNSCGCSHCTRNEGVEMPLSKEQRQTLITNITTDNDVWTAKDKDILEKFDDNRLLGLRKQQLAVNCGDMGGDDGLPKREYKEDEEEDNGKLPVANKLTDAQLYELASPQFKELIKESQRVVNEKKTDLIGRLVANESDETKRKAKIEKLSKKSLEDLRELAELVPTANFSSDNPFVHSQQFAVNDYRGASGYAGPVMNAEERGDILPIPTLEDVA